VTRQEAEALVGCVREGGVAVFPADTVYGLACDPESEPAVRRLYELKGRGAGKPAAVMFFDVPAALGALPELDPATRAAVERLLPAALTLLLPNPGRRYPLAGGRDPATLGLRVPRLEALEGTGLAVLQSSANRARGPDAARLADVPRAIRTAADLVIDGGDLPGAPSTVIDLRGFAAQRSFEVVREGAVPRDQLERALSSLS
jgi:L-threonylcarbamoyladenylate synthase